MMFQTVNKQVHGVSRWQRGHLRDGKRCRHCPPIWQGRIARLMDDQRTRPYMSNEKF